MQPSRLVTLGQLRLDPPATSALGGRRKELVLLAYLARRSPRPVPREQLAALFWSVQDEARARHSLRQALHRLRQVLGDGLMVDASGVWLAESAVELDATLFEREIAAGELESAVSRWGGDFLSGAEDSGGEEYRAWLEAEREALRRKLARAFDRLGTLAEEQGARNEAVLWAGRWVEALPHDEAARDRLTRAQGLASRTAEGRPGAAAVFTPDMVARGAAFAELVAAWQGVRSGAGSVVLVEGEEGVGKSRLVQEFVRWTAGTDPPPLLLHATASELDDTSPWSAARRLLAALRAAPGLGGAADAALGELARLVPTLRDRFPHLPAQSGSEESLMRATRNVLSDVAAEIPIVLVLDDMGVADGATQQLALGLAQDPPAHVLLLFTDRSDLLPTAAPLTRLRQLPGLRHIHLRPLSVGDVATLVASMVALSEEERHALAHRLHAENGGNPLYTIEQIHALAEHGLLALDNHGAWHVAPGLEGRPLPLPLRVRAVSRNRLDRLDTGSRTVVEAAAVLGATGVAAWLERMAGLPPADFSAAVDTLLSRRILRETGPEPGHLQFTHPLMRRTVYEQLSPARRHALHRAAFVAIETDPATHEDSSALLEWHRERASPARSRATRVRARLAAAALLILMLATAAGLLLTRREVPAISPSAIAILPFAVQGSPDLAYLREGIPTLLSTGLSGMAGLSVVDPHVLLAAAAREPVPVDPGRGRLLAERFGAGFYVLGTVTAAGGRLQVTASLYDGSGRLQHTAHAAVTDEAATFTLVDDLARQLLANVPHGAGARFTGVAAATTTSLAALKAYLEGETELRAARFGPAANAFARAFEHDETFALAAYRNAVAAEWLKDPEMEAQSIARAMQHRQRLPERDRLLVEAYDAGHRGAADEAERLFRAVLRTHPNDPVAWERLGELLIHYNPMRGRPMNESRPAFERSLVLDPDDTEPLWHLAQLAAMENRRPTLDSLIVRFGTVPEAMALRLIAALLRGDTLEASRYRAELGAASDELLYLSAAAVPLFTDEFREGGRIAALLTPPDRPDRWRAAGHVLTAHTELASGRMRAARAALRAAERLDPGAALPYLGAFAALPFVPAVPTELLSLRHELGRWRADEPVARTIQHPYVDIHDTVRPLLRIYTLGLISASLGDVTAADSFARRLETSPATAGTRNLSHDLALGVRAQASLHDRRIADALHHLESMVLSPEAVTVSLSPFHSHAFERFTRAELLRVLDRYDDAVQWYASVAESPPFGFIYRAPAHLRQAEIHERLGNREKAAYHYARFMDLWLDCDDDLRPHVEQARQRLDALRN